MKNNKTVTLKPEEVLYGTSTINKIVGFDHDTFYTADETNSAVAQRPSVNNIIVCSDSVSTDCVEDVTKIQSLSGNGHFTKVLFINPSDYNDVVNNLLKSYQKTSGRYIESLYQVRDDVIILPWCVQHYVGGGFTLYGDMAFSDIMRCQIDIETTGLNPEKNEVFLVSISTSDGQFYQEDIRTLSNEEALLRWTINTVKDLDPDIIEGHNLLSFDLPFIECRLKCYGIPFLIGRNDSLAYQSNYRPNLKIGGRIVPIPLWIVPSRDVIDTMYLTMKDDETSHRFTNGVGLKAAARTLGIASDNRVEIEGEKIWDTFNVDPDKVRHYARQDVEEVRDLSATLLPPYFELTKIVPADLSMVVRSGPATMINWILIRAYIHSGHSIPAPMKTYGKFEGGMVKLLRSGMFRNVVKFDAISMYPNIMLANHCYPASDVLGYIALLLRHLLNKRLELKAVSKNPSCSNTERQAADAAQKAFKIIINGIYGYMGTPWTHFNDPEQAAHVTALGRQAMHEMVSACDYIGLRVIEVDTDGIYLEMPDECK